MIDTNIPPLNSGDISLHHIESDTKINSDNINGNGNREIKGDKNLGISGDDNNFTNVNGNYINNLYLQNSTTEVKSTSSHLPNQISEKKDSGRSEFILAGSFDHINENKLKAVQALLRQQVSPNADLIIIKAEEGSIKITVEAKLETLELLKTLFESGELTNLLEFPIEDIQILNQDLSNNLEVNIPIVSREILKFKVEFPDNNSYEAPVKIWGNMLLSLQEVIEFIGRQLSDETNKIIAQKTELLATVTYGGSYCIDLVAASTDRDIFQESLVGNSLERFLDMIKVSNKCVPDKNLNQDYSSEEFAIMVNNLGIALVSKYGSFLNHIATAKSDVDFKWESPNPAKGGYAQLSYKSVIAAIKLIERMDKAVPRTIEITGILIAGNVKLKRFEIRDFNNEFTYKGKVSDYLINSDTDMTLDCIYNAVIEETTESNTITGEVNLKYKLIDLSKHQDQFTRSTNKTREITQNDFQVELFPD
jgi:hypothetical protein